MFSATFVGWQWMVAQLPQCARIYDADVQEGPEEVFPPFLARPTHNVVGPHLVKVVDSPHGLVVAHNTGRDIQVDVLVVATGLSHDVSASIIRGDHVHVAHVVPLRQHDPIMTRPLHGLSTV